MIIDPIDTSAKAASRGYRYYLLALLLVVSIIAYSDRLILGFLIDPIKADLDISDTQIGLLTGLAFSTFYALMGLPLGRAIDTYPRNIVLAACISVWSVCTMLCGLAGGAFSLFAARCGIGAGEAAMNPSAVSLIGDNFPRSQVVKALSIYSIGVVGGGGAAILLGGQLIAYLRSLGPITILMFDHVPVWRLVFILLGIPGLVAALFVLFTIRESRPVKSLAASGLPKQSILRSLGFIWQGRAAYVPLLGGLVAFGFYNYAVLGWYPAMFARTFGSTPRDISIYYGIAYLVSGVGGSLIASPLVRFFERKGATDAVATVLCLTSAIAIIPAVAGPLMPSFHAAVACFLVSMLMSSTQTSMAFSSLVLITSPERRGTAVAFYVMLMNLTGASLGNVLIGLLSDHVFGPEHLSRAIALVATIAVPLSLLCFLRLRPAFRAARALEESRIEAVL